MVVIIQTRLGIGADGSGNIFFTGETSSTNFPVSAGAFQPVYGGGSPSSYNAFLVKLNSSGARQWGTFCGGSKDDYSTAESVDNNGNIVITGQTWSSNFPITAGAYQSGLQSGSFSAFIVKFDGNGNQLWGTYFGTESKAFGIAVDLSGNVFISGMTQNGLNPSAGAFQTTYGGGIYDGFLAKFDGNGNYQWSTYCGGSGYDWMNGAATNANGNVFITGGSYSTNFPVTSGAYQTTNIAAPTLNNIILAKFNGNGQIQWATFYGGTGGDNGGNVATDANGNVYCYGATGSGASFPTTSNAFQTDIGTNGVNAAGFILEFDANGNRQYATEFGAKQTNYMTSSYGLALDSNGAIIITGYTNADSSNFPVTSGAFQTQNNGNWNAFVAKFSGCSLHYTQGIKADTICRGSSVMIGNGTTTGGTPPYSYHWSPGNSLSDSTSVAPVASPDSSTKYYESISDAAGCLASNSAFVFVDQPVVVSAGPNISLCTGIGAQIGEVASSGTPPYKYQWSPVAGLDTASKAQPFATPNTTTKYILTVTDKFGCEQSDSMLFTVYPQPQALAGGPFAICPGDTATLGLPATGGTAPYTYQWSPANSSLNSTNIASPKAFPDSTTKYYLTVTDADRLQ